MQSLRNIALSLLILVLSGGSALAEIRWRASIPLKCTSWVVAHSEIQELTFDDAWVSTLPPLPAQFTHYSGTKKLILQIASPRYIVEAMNAVTAPFYTANHVIGASSIPAFFEEGVDYNFIFVGNTFVFARTGTAFIRDLVSKHSVLSQLSSVMMAGKIRRVGDRLVLLNDSGTYRPDAERLEEFLTYMRAQTQVEIDAQVLRF